MEFFEDHRLELYNLAEDLGESRNLAASHPEKTRELHQQMLQWRSELKAPMPTPKEPTAAASSGKKSKGKGGGKKKKKAEPSAK
jgi:hypothetical protein